MFRMLAAGFALALAALVTGQVAADDKKDTTAWVRDVEGLELVFKVGKDAAAFEVTAGDNGLTVNGKLTPVKGKKDRVEFEVTEVKEKGEFPTKPKKGDKFSFKWVVKDDKATISDVEGDLAEEAKPGVAGDYKKNK